MICSHCDKVYTNKIGFSNHVRRCPKNPDRIHEGLTEEGRQRISQATTNKNNNYWSNEENIEKHKLAMRRAVEMYPESYTSSNRGRTKQQIVDGVKLQGQWEVDFYKWATTNSLNPSRPTLAFKYTWNGERWYHPDFYIESLDVYVEVKGFETDRDRAKWQNFNEKLCIIRKEEIKQIREGTFDVDKLLLTLK